MSISDEVCDDIPGKPLGWNRENKNFKDTKYTKNKKIRLTVVFMSHTYITMSMPTQKQDKHTTWNIMPLSVAQEKKTAETRFTIKTHTSDEDCMHNTLTLGAENLTTVDVQWCWENLKSTEVAGQEYAH